MASIVRAAFFALAFLSTPAFAAADRSEYWLTFRPNADRSFQVRADLPVSGGELFMAPPTLAEPLAHGFADFIHNLDVKDLSGRPVRAKLVGKGRWQLSRPVKRVRISYEVRLTHEKVKWAVSGTFARGYAVKNGMFFFGNVAFITGTSAYKLPARVRFTAPAQWQVATALAEVRGSKGLYEAPSWDGLTLTGSMVGRLSTSRVRSGPLDVILAAPRELATSISMMSAAIRPIIDGYARDMGGSPRGRRAVFLSVAPFSNGGETTENTISLMYPSAPDASTRSAWTYVIAHETFHLWNGTAIEAQTPAEMEWFREGFTTYMAMLASYRAGLISEDELFRQIADGYAWYRPGAGKLSLREAGANKGPNESFIYYGGMAVALAIDIEGRLRSPDSEHAFITMMRMAHDEFGKTGKRYAYEDIVRLASRAAGTDMSAFFSRHVDKSDPIPLAGLLKKVGLLLAVVDGKVVLTRDPSASAAKRGLFPARPPASARVPRF